LVEPLRLAHGCTAGALTERRAAALVAARLAGHALPGRCSRECNGGAGRSSLALRLGGARALH